DYALEIFQVVQRVRKDFTHRHRLMPAGTTMAARHGCVFIQQFGCDCMMPCFLRSICAAKKRRLQISWAALEDARQHEAAINLIGRYWGLAVPARLPSSPEDIVLPGCPGTPMAAPVPV